MGNILDKFIWLFTGIFGSHVGHFIYQTRYAERISEIKLSESLAMVFEDMLLMLFYFMDMAVPLFMASLHLILIIIGLIGAMIFFFIGYKLYLKIKSESVYNQKLKEAENIMAEARTQAEEEIEAGRQLKKKLIKEFKKKEQIMSNNLEKKLAEYKEKIKKLEAERLELKETTAGLMRQLKGRKA